MYCGLRSDYNVTLVYSLCMMVYLYKYYVSTIKKKLFAAL